MGGGEAESQSVLGYKLQGRGGGPVGIPHQGWGPSLKGVPAEVQVGPGGVYHAPAGSGELHRPGAPASHILPHRSPQSRL